MGNTPYAIYIFYYVCGFTLRGDFHMNWGPPREHSTYLYFICVLILRGVDFPYEISQDPLIFVK